MGYERRTVVGALGAAFAPTAGCLRASTGVDPSNGDSTMELRNDLDEPLTVEVAVTPTDADDSVLDEQYDLDAGGTRTVSIAARGPFRVAASMVDGPVESIFEHRWDTDANPTLTVTFDASGVDYD